MVAEQGLKKARDAVRRANRQADLIELRLDYLRSPAVEPFLAAGQKPMIVTNRWPEEGGRFKGGEGERLALLKRAAELGAAFVDLEFRCARSAQARSLMAQRNGTAMVLSYHDFRQTPSWTELQDLLTRMSEQGAEVVKVVSLANSFEDNLKLLGLIPLARRRGQEIVAFCMGPKGKMSRIFSPLMGGAWTYAPLKKERASAPGQLTAPELREMWQRLR